MTTLPSPEQAGAETAGSPLVPRLITPVEEEPVDGSAAALEWESVSDALDYELQVATDDAFEQLRCAVATGPTTRLTLYEMLPEDGSVFYWRVRAQTPAGWQAWSETSRFKADTDAAVYAHRTRQETLSAGTAPPGSRPAAHAGDAEAEEDVEAGSPYRTDHTSGTAIALFFAMMIVSFAILVYLNARLVEQMHEARAARPVATASSSTVPAQAIDQAMESVVREAAAPQPADSSWRVPE